MPVIKHLSVAVRSPSRAAQVLADLSGGHAQPFKTKTTMEAWVCLWDAAQNELIELLPQGWIMYATSEGASFKKLSNAATVNATHIQLEVSTSLKEIQSIANKYECLHYARLNPRSGGPLYEVWIEEDFLVELVSNEIAQLK